MELKEGMYVRTIYGIKKITDIICGQDIRFDNTNGFDEDLLKYHDLDGISKNSHTWEEIVIGEPKEKIIELIEVGDYVNGNKIVYIQEEEFPNYPKRLLFAGVDENNIDEVWEVYNKDDIKSIVTKEQFESIKYEVE